MLRVGVVALGVGDVEQSARFWCEVLGYELRTDGFGGWATVLTPPAGPVGTKIALRYSETPWKTTPVCIWTCTWQMRLSKRPKPSAS